MKARVALIGPHPAATPGGMATVLNSLLGARQLREAGYDVTLIATHVEGSVVRKVAAAVRALVAFASGQWDLVHVHAASGWSVERKALFVWIARVRRIPVVLHLHGADQDADIERGSSRHARAFRRMVERSAVVIVLSESWKDWLERRMPGANVRVLHNAVDVPDLAAPLPGEPAVLFLGRLGKRKGVWDLLDAAPEFLAAAPDARMILAGDGEVDEVRAHLERSPALAGRVDVTGWIAPAEVAGLIERSWVVTLPSYAEGLPMAVLEAMGRSRPVVTTTVGGIPAVVREGVDGYLVAPGDRIALAKRLGELLTEKERCEQLGRSARERIESMFSFDKAMRSLLEIYGCAMR